MKMFITALFITGKTQKEHKCPTPGDWLLCNRMYSGRIQCSPQNSIVENACWVGKGSQYIERSRPLSRPLLATPTPSHHHPAWILPFSLTKLIWSPNAQAFSLLRHFCTCSLPYLQCHFSSPFLWSIFQLANSDSAFRSQWKYLSPGKCCGALQLEQGSGEIFHGSLIMAQITLPVTWSFNCLYIWQMRTFCFLTFYFVTGWCLLSIYSESRHLPVTSLAAGIKARLLFMFYKALCDLAGAHSSNPSPVIVAHSAHWPSCFSDMPTAFLPQGLCICCLLCLEWMTQWSRRNPSLQVAHSPVGKADTLTDLPLGPRFFFIKVL